MPENIFPMVSVIICTRGRTEMLERAVGSVLRNSYPGFELILIDQNRDDSTISAFNICMHYEMNC